jgi:predicted amidohydrolase YtcJ
MRIFVNGRIRTMDATVPAGTAMAVDEGLVVAVGDDDAIRRLAGAGDEIVNLECRPVLPGFEDAHLHLSDGAIALGRLDLRNAGSAETVAALVADRAAGLTWGTWIRGFGWDQTRWDVKEWPHRSVLEARCADHPVALARIDGHVGWLNGLALQILGIDASTPDPAGGRIERDPRTSEPTGILLEAAWDQVRARIPRESRQDRKLALERALAEMRRLGITAVHDVTDATALPLLADLLAAGKLSARISAILPIGLDREAAEALRRGHTPGHPWIETGTLKVFLDGTLGSRSAALLEPYADAPAASGALRIAPDALETMIAEADAAGWTVAVHAIGDLAVRTALDAFEALPERRRDRPHRIEHVQVVADEDLPRFRRTGVVASVQPVHFREDLPWIADRLGERAGARIYPARSLLEAGASVAFGTDWPIAPLDPWLGIGAATSQRGPTSDAHGEAGIAEDVPLEVALRAYTEAPARLSGRKETLGRLAPGCFADFVVLDCDPVGPIGIELGESPRVTRTYVDGRCVFPDGAE